MKCLIISASGSGNVNPLLPVAQGLLDEGHHVSWLAIPEPSKSIRDLGVSIVEMGEVSLPAPKATRRDPRDVDSMLARLRYNQLEVVPTLRDAFRKVLRAERPDVVVLTGMHYATILTCATEGVPYVNVSCGLQLLTPRDFECPWSKAIDRFDPERRALFAEHGVEADFRLLEHVSPTLNLVYSVPQLVPKSADLPNNVTFIGAPISAARSTERDAVAWEDFDEGRPLLFASFGTVVVPDTQRLATAAKAAEVLDWSMILSTGQGATVHVDPARGFARPSVPQLDVLKKASVMISHGGANSTTESLSFGVPLLICPFSLEQPLQGRLVEEVGAGRVVSPDAFNVDRVVEVLRELQDAEAGFRSRAVALSRALRERDPRRASVSAIVDCLS